MNGRTLTLSTVAALAVAGLAARRRGSRATVPDPYAMTRDEFLAGSAKPEAKPGYQLLYHVTDLKNVDSIAKHGLLLRRAQTEATGGGIWSSAVQDAFYGGGGGALIVFQVPARGTPADRDVDNAVLWDIGDSVVLLRDVAPEDIVAIDPYFFTPWGAGRLSHFRNNAYAEQYWDKVFAPKKTQ